jgi:hypothetical protein
MKSYKSIIIAAAITPVISVGAAFAKPRNEAPAKPRGVIAGVVLEINRSDRTMVVRGDDGSRTTVRVPEGRQVALSPVGNFTDTPTVMPFERAYRGLHVRMVAAH